MNRRLLWMALAISACGGPPDSLGLVFYNGRAVTPYGDSLAGLTTQGVAGLLIYHHYAEHLDTIAWGVLQQPVHVETVNGRWFVSDVDSAGPSIKVLAHDGALLEEHSLRDIVATPHQFAVLPDARIVVETQQGSLAALRGDSLEEFALVEVGLRPSLLTGASGGVLHAIPDQHITLYNAFGHIRWRVEWPWAETAYVTDIAVDRNGRIHFIAGIPRDDTFVVYTMGREDGQILRWSEPGPYASFLVRLRGALEPVTDDPW